MNRKSIEFYMVVTNRSVYIADYCVRALLKTFKNLSKNYDVILNIYLNSINICKYDKYINKWKKLDKVVITYSDMKPSDFVFENGIYKTSNGKEYLYPMEFEEAFDKGYFNSKADYFVSLDDDFEVLNPILISDMLNYMENHPELPVFSTDKTNTNIFFDTYTNSEIILHERNDTWFTIYNNRYKVSDISCHPVDYYIKKDGEIRKFIFRQENWSEYIKSCKEENSIRHVYDGMGWLQKTIREIAYHEIVTIKDVDKNYDNMYIHYGAFTQNSFVNTKWKIKVYRFLSIHQKIGYLSFPQKTNAIIKHFFRILFRIIFVKAIAERRTHSHVSVLD